MIRERGTGLRFLLVAVLVLPAAVLPAETSSAQTKGVPATGVPARAAAAASYLNPRLAQTEEVPGRVLDVGVSSLLLLDASTSPAALKVWDRVANEVTATVPAHGTWQPETGFLTPRGVLFTALEAGTTYPGARVRLVGWPRRHRSRPDGHDDATRRPTTVRDLVLSSAIPL